MRKSQGGWLFLVAILLLLSMPFGVCAQITFERAYGGPAYDEGCSVQQTSDGCYILTGVGNLVTSTQQGKVYLLRTDSLGDTLWSKTFGADSGIDWGMSVRQTLDGGFIIAGYSRDLGPGLNDVYFIKTDEMGETLWTRVYGGSEHDVAYSIQQTQDGGYIATGMTSSFGDSMGDTYLIRMDNLGDTLWTKTFGSAVGDVGHSVLQTLDDGYAIAGVTNYNYSSQTSDMYLAKTDSQGNPQWTRTYGPDGAWNVCEEVGQTLDGGYIFAGTAFYSPYAAGADRIYLVRTDSLGDTLWSRTYLGGDRSRGTSVRQTQDGGYVVAGYRMDFDGLSKDVFVLRTDSLGDTLWTRIYGGSNSDLANSVCLTSDSGFAVCGWTKVYGTRLMDVYLIKLDDSGHVVVRRNAGVVSLDSPGGTVFTDSTYEVVATVENLGNTLDSLSVVATLDGYCDTVAVPELDPGSSFEVHFANWQVPSPDSITYTMTVCTHVIGDIDTTNDCMEKTILAYDDPTGTEESFGRQSKFGFRLYANEPNPFSRSTVIEYSLPTQCEVTLSVYNVTGGLVETIVDQRQGAGVFQARWDARGHTEGIYFCRLRAGDFTETRKMVLVR